MDTEKNQPPKAVLWVAGGIVLGLLLALFAVAVMTVIVKLYQLW